MPQIRAPFRVLLIVAAALVIAPEVRAKCGISVSASVSGTTLTATGTATGACGGTNISLYLNGIFGRHLDQKSCGGPSCTLTVTTSTACLATGTHFVEGFASCNKTRQNPDGTTSCVADEGDSQKAHFSVNTEPTVSVSASGFDIYGHGTIDVGYSFPNTNSSGQRRLGVYLDGSLFQQDQLEPATESGQWSIPIFSNCRLTPIPIRARATACGPGNGAPYDEAFTTAPPPSTKPSITTFALKKGVDPATGRKRFEGTVGWDMGRAATDWKIGVRVLAWVTADGRSHPGGAILGELAQGRVGQKTFIFYPPSGARQVIMEAGASSCVGRDVKEASIDCDLPQCATQNPVYLSDGNVRVPDFDSLPEIAGQRLVRTYDSDEQIVALFGRGWTTLFDQRLILNDGGLNELLASIVTDTNEIVTFRGVGGVFSQTWPRARNAHGTLTHDAAAGTYVHRPAGSGESTIFSASDGRLVAIRNVASGREAQIAYDANGLPQTLTDSWTGTAWNLTVDVAKRLVTSVAVNGRPDLTWTYAYDASGNLLSVLAPGGAAWRTYEYLADRMTASRDPLGNLIESHDYDAQGRGINSTGPDDEIDQIEYDLPGVVPEEQVTRVTYKTGAIAEYAFRPVGGAYRTVRITGGCASCGADDTTYVRDVEGRIVREQGPDGYVTVRTYAANRLYSERGSMRPQGCDPQTDPANCRLGHDALAAAALEATPVSVLRTFTHGDPVWPDRVTAIEMPGVLGSGRVRREEYVHHPVSGALVSTTVRGWTGEPAVETTRTTVTSFYSGDAAAFAPGGSFQTAWLSLPQPALLAKSVDGPRSDVQDVTSFVYYPVHASVPALLRGRLAATKNAAGHIVRYEDYDVFGNTIRVVDANGVVSEVTADALGRVLTSTLRGVSGCDTIADPLCGTDLTTASAYAPAAGPLKSMQSPAGGPTVYTYDDRGRVRTISRGPALTDLREQVESTYDPLTGNKSLERTLALENGAWVEKRRESFAYDAEGRLQTVTHADGAAVHYAYDAAGRISSVRDENHATPNTRYTFDPAGRVSVVTQTLAGATGGVITTRYAYDLHGNLLTVTDPNGNITRYVYDDFGAMLSQTSPVSGTTRYVYDPAGELVSVTDANGATTTRTYDALGRVVSAASARGELTESIAWTWDGGTLGKGRLSEMSDPTGQTVYAYERRGLLIREGKTIAGDTYTTTFSHDGDGNRSRIGYPSGRAVTYGHDYAGRPVTAAAGGVPLVSAATYLPFGPATSLDLGNNTRQTMSFDSRYRMTANRLGRTADGSIIADYGYGHDPAGNITGIQDLQASPYDRVFGYDDLHRLTTANTGSALWGAGSYQYDRMGNLLQSSLGAWTTTFSLAGTTPKIASVNDGTGARTVTYDAAGNETATGSRTYSYSPRNHLLAAERRYSYDGRGVRTSALCGAAITPTTAAISAAGGSQTLSIAVAADCAWTAASLTSWITVTSGTLGSGNGTVSYSVTANPTTVSRTGTIEAGGQLFTVTQAAATTAAAFRSDFDGDGFGDVLLRDNATSNIEVLLMKGSGAASRIPIDALPRRTIVGGIGDFWGDGTTSFAVMNRDTREVTLWKMNGTAVVARSLVGTIGSLDLRLVGAGDFNGDGKSDLLWRNDVAKTLTLWFLNGAQLVSETPINVTMSDSLWRIAGIADFGGDGKSDVLFRNGVNGRLAMWEMDGATPTNTAMVVDPLPATTWQVEDAADFDGDGKADILLRDPATSELRIWRMNGHAVLTKSTVGTLPDRRSRVVAFAPFTADTRADVLLRHSGTGVLRVWQSDGAALTTLATVATLPTIRHSVEAAPRLRPAATKSDFGGDGQGDILLRHATTNEMVMWEMSGRTVRRDQPLGVIPGSSWKLTRLGDVHGDRLTDILWRHTTTNQLALWAMLGRTLTNGNVVGTLAPSISVIAMADLDGDGNAEVLFRNAGNGELTMGRIVNHQLSSTSVLGTVGSEWSLIAAGDFNGDGTDDLMFRNMNTQAVDLWEMNGTTILAQGVIGTVNEGPAWKTVGVGDYNGDGMADLLWRYDNPPRMALWEMNGRALIGSAVFRTVSSTLWLPKGAADYNGDRQTDVLWRHTPDDVVAMWEMNGRQVLDDRAFGQISSPLLETQPAFEESGALWAQRDPGADTLSARTSEPRGSALPAWRPPLDPELTTFVPIRDGVSTSLPAVGPPTWTRTFGPQIGANGQASMNDHVRPDADTMSVTEPELAPVAQSAGSGERQHFLYTPELNLMAETTSSATPVIQHEYVWFGGRPLAQIETATNVVHWYFNDHLGTPLLQTDASATVVWRVEYEPYGTVYTHRAGASKHQPLRFPGQEQHGSSDLSYNIFRWYRAGWGRYTQADPIGLDGGVNLFAYVAGNPLRFTDRLGLDNVGCDSYLGRAETRCELQCCARHDACYDTYNCSSGSWGKKPTCGCDQSGECKTCNSTATSCITDCQRTQSPGSRTEPLYYCGAQHRFIRIPGDFPDRKTAEQHCEYNYSKDCTTPVNPKKKPKRQWRFF